jgi:flagellar export protein FliJ
MTPSREEAALAKLLKLAKLRADEAILHLARLEESRRAAENAIAWLAKAVAAEERGSGANAAALLQFQLYLDGAEAKRQTLAATRDRLSSEVTKAQDAAAEASAEIKKLEHLLGMRSEASRWRRAKAEAALADERETMRRSRR